MLEILLAAYLLLTVKYAIQFIGIDTAMNMSFAGALADAAVSIAMAHSEVLSCTILEKGDCEVIILLLLSCLQSH